MSAEALREAARLMRERALTARRNVMDAGWKPGPTLDPDNNGWYVAMDVPDADWDTTVAHLPYDYEGETAPHIASWHPAVALAVADWLDAKADQDDKGTCDDPRGCCNLCEHDYGHIAALAVATAYLGATP